MIHKEGRSFLVLLLALLLVLNIAIDRFLSLPDWLGFSIIGVSAILFLFFLQFFRNPSRKITKGDDLVIAPADGKVVVIENTKEEEFLNSERIQVSIFMSPLNVHVNRSPVDATIKYYRYHKGKYLVAWHPKSSTENERTTVVFEKENGIQILCRQIAGAAARRIKCYVKEGESRIQGEEFGFIKFGSRVDVFLPIGTDVLVGLNENTKGGVTPIARLK